MFGVRASLRPSIAALGGLIGGAYYLNQQQRRKDCASVIAASTTDTAIKDAAVKDVIRRLGPYIMAMRREGTDHPDMKLRSQKKGVDVYGLEDVAMAKHKKEGGFSVVRVAHATIDVPVEEVARLWWKAGERKQWDSANTIDSQLVKVISPSERVVYLQGKPKAGGMVSSRDFVYSMHRLEGTAAAAAVPTGAYVGSVLFVQCDKPAGAPSNKDAVRGDVNSLLLLEPVGVGSTKASYAIEVEVKGWLPQKVVEGAADDMPLTLAVMRDHLEAEAKASLTMSADEVAKRRVRTEESEMITGGARRHSTSRPSSSSSQSIASAIANKEELLAAKQVLEKQLKGISGDEKKLGVKLTDVRRKLQEKLDDINRRL